MKTILFRKLEFVLGAACALVTAGASLRAEEAVRAAPVFDGLQFVKDSMEERVGEPSEIQRVPLFDNAPFLKLKTGDKLLKGKHWIGSGKGEAPHFAENESYFLRSGGTHYELETQEQGGKLFLSGYYSLLFDWEVNLQNATRLYESDRGSLGEAISPKSFENLKDAVKREFPETLRDVGTVEVSAPHLAGEGKTRRAIFQGLGFDRFRKTVFKYQLEIGNSTHIQYRKNLIVGPRRVERWEFEGEEGGGINGPGRYHPDAETAAKARAAYDRMIAFENVVNKFLVKPRTGQAGFQ